MEITNPKLKFRTKRNGEKQACFLGANDEGHPIVIDLLHDADVDPVELVNTTSSSLLRLDSRDLVDKEGNEFTSYWCYFVSFVDAGAELQP